MSLNELGELIEYPETRERVREKWIQLKEDLCRCSAKRKITSKRVANVAREATFCDMVLKKCSRASASFLLLQLS